MKRKLKFITLKAILVFSFLEANEPYIDRTHLFPIDVSVYDGEGTLLIHWIYPDTILGNNVQIFVRESGSDDFQILTELPAEQSYYLHDGCKQNLRYFYQIKLKDSFGKIFTSDTVTSDFGTCLSIEDPTAYTKQIFSIKDLVLSHILNKAKEHDKYLDYESILGLINIDKPVERMWFENFSIKHLKSIEPALQILNDCFLSSFLLDEVLLKETLYRNYLLIKPESWFFEVENSIFEIQSFWKQLIKGHSEALERLEMIAPIRIVRYRITKEHQKELTLQIFKPEQLASSEIFLLADEEYVNLGEFFIENDQRIKLIVPDHWQSVDLMMDDIFIQSCPINFDDSISFTLDGDFIPADKETIINVGRLESSLWLNELIWNPYLKTIQVEIAGNPDIEDQYSIFIKDKIIWEIQTNLGYEPYYQDSTIKLQDEINFPVVLSFKKAVIEEFTPIEYIVLDSLPFAISRLPDGGPWYYTETTTLGISNEPIKESFKPDLLPELFVLYQNYPNPFNGTTRITFDLLEDAYVSLYITDATGRIHAKFLEGEFISSGTYNYNWNGEGKSTGIYFFTIQTQVDNRVPTTFSRKMIYLK